MTEAQLDRIAMSPDEDTLGVVIHELRRSRELLSQWLGQCECDPESMPPNIYDDTRGALGVDSDWNPLP